MDEKTRLRRKIQQENREREKRSKNISISIARVIERELPRILRDVETDADVDRISLLFSLYETLKARGIDAALDDVFAAYEEEFRAVIEEYERIEGNNVFTRVDADVWETVISKQVADLDNLVGKNVNELGTLILNQVTVGVPVDYDALIDGVSGRTANQIVAEVNTGMQIFNRSVTIKKAVDLYGKNPRFLYIGPDDKVTRQFCHDTLNNRTPPIYSLNEILAMDNGQKLPALEAGGGYNCRHDWRPVSKELEDSFK